MMRREENLRPAVLVATLAAAVLGFALRLWQLRQGRERVCPGAVGVVCHRHRGILAAEPARRTPGGV